MTRQKGGSYARWPLNGKLSRRGFLTGAALGTSGIFLQRSGLAAAKGTLPGTRVNPYVLPSASGVDTTAILTVGDLASGNGYRMAGIPDGLGAFNNGDDTFTVLMNHEIPRPLGIRRAHGSPGAFVSKWIIEKATFRVLNGADLTPSGALVRQWDVAGKKYVQGTTDWQRLRSADLPDQKALSYQDVGTTDRIFFNGEEVNDGRAWARIVTGSYAGSAWQLPRLGRMAFENVVLSPHSKDKTIAIMMDDGSLPPVAPALLDAATNPSEVFVYVGSKQSQGTPIEQAGLTNGKLYGIRVYRGASNLTLLKEESNDFGLGDAGSGYVKSGRFDLVELGANGDVSDLSALQLEQDALAKSVFRLQRPEDGAWDPRGGNEDDVAPKDFYFVTTASITQNSRLWRLRFNNLAHPEDGGTIEILLNATKGRMFDNITIDRRGRLLLQEDTGNDPWVSKVWLYGIDKGSFVELAHHDPMLFQPDMSPATFITQDEESSGIIDAEDVLGPGWFLFDIQVHKNSADPELVEGGQLVSMFVPLGIR